jgi:hypothetical protein
MRPDRSPEELLEPGAQQPDGVVLVAPSQFSRELELLRVVSDQPVKPECT